MNWGTYRDTILRSLLKDNLSGTTTRKWSDAELLSYANWALADLATVALSTVSCSLTGAGPSHVLPADYGALESIVLIENDRTIVLEPFSFAAGTMLDFDLGAPDGTSDAGYLLDWPQEGYITISPARAGSSYTLVYSAALADIAADADVLPFTGSRRWLAQAVACYVGYCAHLREGVGRAALEQWSQRPDLAVKNPLNAEAEQWLKAYRLLVSDHRERSGHGLV